MDKKRGIAHLSYLSILEKFKKEKSLLILARYINCINFLIVT